LTRRERNLGDPKFLSAVDWASYKQSVLKTKSGVSDKDYQRFKNRKRDETLEKINPSKLPF
jgi:hypothetical protein